MIFTFNDICKLMSKNYVVCYIVLKEKDGRKIFMLVTILTGLYTTEIATKQVPKFRIFCNVCPLLQVSLCVTTYRSSVRGVEIENTK
jgi:hypothetical protein